MSPFESNAIGCTEVEGGTSIGFISVRIFGPEPYGETSIEVGTNRSHLPAERGTTKWRGRQSLAAGHAPSPTGRVSHPG